MVCATSNFNTKCSTARRLMLTHNGTTLPIRRRTPEDVLHVCPEVRERSVEHGIGTAPLRPIIAGEKQRRRQTHYDEPIVAQLSTDITRRPTRKLTLSKEWRQKRKHRQVVRTSWRSGTHQLTKTLRKLHKGVLFLESSSRGDVRCRGPSHPTEGTTRF